MPDLQAFAKARFRALAFDFWKLALQYLPNIIRAVFGTQGNDHADLQRPILERCVSIYKNIITNTECIEAMDTYPTSPRGLLQAVGKHLEVEKNLLTHQIKQLAEDIGILNLTAENHVYDTSSMHSALRVIHKKLSNISAKGSFTSRGRGGRGRVNGKGSPAFEEEIKSVIQILLPYIEDESHEWVEECYNSLPGSTSGDGW